MFTLSSPAFENAGSIPAMYTRKDGTNQAPPLQWSNVPPNTASLALIVDDPDAPDPAAPKMTWVHWVVYNISPTVTTLSPDSPSPPGMMTGQNDWQENQYDGPQPPKGRHRYFFKLYALDTVLKELTPPANKESLLRAMEGHVLGEAVLIGTYQKKQWKHLSKNIYYI